MSGAGDVVVTYLELRAPQGGRAIPGPGPVPFALERQRPPVAATVAAAMYARVGAPWHWTDRLQWTAADWQRAIDRDDVELWLAIIDGEPAGYFELEVQERTVELRYFGLAPTFTGRGLGRFLLLAASERAWALGKDRMTVNTCTLDHPAALATYQRHGFVMLRTETRRAAAP